MVFLKFVAHDAEKPMILTIRSAFSAALTIISNLQPAKSPPVIKRLSKYQQNRSDEKRSGGSCIDG